MGKAKKEKTGIPSYTMGVVSNVMSYIVVSNLTYCLTQSAAMAAGTVGAIFLLSRLLDGVSDIIGGFIIDHTNTRWGKARPFDLVSIPLWISIVLCFSVPELSTVGKIIWVFLTYNLSQTVCYTLINGANPVRLKRSIKEEYRVKAVAIGAFITTVVSTAVGIAMPILISIFENRAHGWTIISSIFAVLGIALSMFCFFTLKERDDAEDDSNAGTEVITSDKLSFVESAKLLFKNPYVFISTFALMMLSILNNLSAVANYYFSFVVGDISLASIASLVSILGIALIAVMPAIQKKVGCRGTFVLGMLILAVGHMAKLIMPVSVLWLAACGALATGGQVLAGSTRAIVNIDCMNYGQRQTGVQLEGLYSCVNGFGDKVGLGLGSFLLGFIMDIAGFDGQLAVQSASAITSIKLLYTVVPAVVAIIGVVIMLFYNEKIVRGEN